MTDLANVPAAPASTPTPPRATTVAARPTHTAGRGGADQRAGVQSLRDSVRLLARHGFSPVEAGNLAALLVGLWPAPGGWTVTQIEHLRFLRGIVRDGRLEP